MRQTNRRKNMNEIQLCYDMVTCGRKRTPSHSVFKTAQFSIFCKCLPLIKKTLLEKIQSESVFKQFKSNEKKVQHNSDIDKK